MFLPLLLNNLLTGAQPVTLIIENGSIVAGADSFATRAEFIAYALKRGITVANDVAADAKLVKAFDFINGLESSLMGWLVSELQEGAYPRYGLLLQTFSIASTVVPKQAKQYQLSLALDLEAGIDIFNPGPSASTPVRVNRVEGVVTQEFAVADSSPIMYQSLSNDLRRILEGSKAGGIRLVMG
jgi:hypothetical protein